MIELELLGRSEVAGTEAGDDAGAPVLQPKRFALLAYLAAARPRGFQRRDSLLALFWPESSQEHARNALNQALHSLREELGSDVVVSRGREEVGVASGALRSDVAAFDDAFEEERYEAALELYRGDFMAGFHVGEAPGFERWVDGERARLRRQAQEAAARLADEREEAGNPVGAARWLERALEISPGDESILQRLLTLLDRAGDRAGAVRAYRRFAAELRARYGTGPSPETVELAARIRARTHERDLLEATADTAIRANAAGGASAEPPGAASPPGSRAAGEVAGEAEARERTPADLGSSRRVRDALAASAALLAIVIALAVTASLTGPDGPAAGEPDRSVAVLPIRYLGPAGEHPSLGEAMTEELTSALGQIPDLTVVGRESARRAAESRSTARETARALDVAFLLRGSVQEAGGRAELTVHLVDGRTGQNVWSRTYRRELVDMLDAQADVARRVADRLASSFSDSAWALVEARATDDPVAYDLYLRAQALDVTVPENRERAIALLRRALERDPDFWLARVPLVRTYYRRARFDGPAWLDSTRAALEEEVGLVLPPRVEVVFEAFRALMLGRHADEALARLQAAARDNPTDLFIVSNVQSLCATRGMIPEAVRWIRQQTRLDPLAPHPWMLLAFYYREVDLLDRAERALLRAMALEPDAPEVWVALSRLRLAQERPAEALAALDSARAHGMTESEALGPRTGPLYWERGLAHLLAGDAERARTAFESLGSSRLRGLRPELALPVAYARLALRDSAAAERILGRVATELEARREHFMDPETATLTARLEAEMAALRGDGPRAGAALARYVDLGGRDYNGIRVSPLFDPVRDDAAFREEVGRLATTARRMRRRITLEALRDG